MSKLDDATFLQGDVNEKLEKLEDESVQTVITSPPYWGLRDYSKQNQIGLEPTPEEYVDSLVEVFQKVKRVLSSDGTVWINIGDSYYANKGKNGSSKARRTAEERGYRQSDGTPMMETRPQDRPHEFLKGKDLCMMPSRVAMALQRDGWYVRSRIVWNKTSCMPESVTDRPTSSHEYIFLLTKNKHYYYDADAIRTPLKSESIARAKRGVSSDNKRANGAPGQNRNSLYEPKDEQGAINPNGANKRDVWTVGTASFPEAHFAVYPVELIEPCVLAGSSEGDTVLDPFSGAATTGIAALKNGRKYVGVELNEDYIELSKERIRDHNEVPANHSFW